MNIKINNKEYKASEGQSILDVSKENKIDIPALCFHPDLCVKATCRLCLIEIKGKKGLFTSCSTMVEDGMEVLTESSDIQKARKINLELIFAQHKEECPTCIYRFNCELKRLAEKYGVDIDRFVDRKTDFPDYKFGNAINFRSSKCIDCGNCIEACHKQSVDYLEKREQNNLYEVVPTKDPTKNCTFCGQCLIHCPVGAIEAIGEYEDIEKPLVQKKMDKKVVFMIAPSIRTTIGEEFGMEVGSIVTGKLVSSIKKLGADYVLDVDVGADFTTTEEAKELVEKVKNKEGVCLSSCCPAWVRFVECNYPELTKHVATTRPPHIIMGGLVKSFFAKKIGVKPENIITVSVMPCTAKKFEITRQEYEIDGMKPVDFVLTTREMAFLLHKHNIDLSKMEDMDFDNMMGKASGAGDIYGVSGGVLEAAMRNAKDDLTTEVKATFVAGLGEARKICEELIKNPFKYDAVEVMACEGGCIGGGGQSVPTSKAIRAKRAAGLRKIDEGKTVKRPKDNPIIKEIYETLLKDEATIKKYCHRNP